MAFKKQKRLLELVSNDRVVTAFDSTYNKSGYKEALLAAAKTWEKVSDIDFIPPDNMYWLYASAGDINEALRWVTRGYVVHDSGVPYIGAIPLVYDLLKDEQEYKDLLNTLGLP